MSYFHEYFNCCFNYKYNPQEIELKQRSKEIDNSLRRERKNYKKEVKFLLLGTGGSGKSTFIKQMRIIHHIPFSLDLLNGFKTDIYDNIIEGMRILCQRKQDLNIPWEYPLNCLNAECIMKWDKHSNLNLNVYFHAVKSLWMDSSIKLLQSKHKETHLVSDAWDSVERHLFQSEAIDYFYNNLERILSKDYQPTNDDVLHIRKATKGIVELAITVNNIVFRFIDVGGQRSQRRKWILCFENISAVLFLVSSTEYDQSISKEKELNKISESQLVFGTIANHHLLSNTSIILFLSKMDLLKRKLNKKESNIKNYFPQFTGDPFNINDVQQFLAQFYIQACKRRKDIFHHFVTVVDTHNIQIVYDDVRKSVMQRNLQNLMLQ